MARDFRYLICAWGALFGPGCSEKPTMAEEQQADGGTDAATPDGPEAFIEELGRAYCERMFNCVVADDDVIGMRAVLGSVDGCRAYLAGVLIKLPSALDVLAKARDGRLTFSEEGAVAYLAQVRTCSRLEVEVEGYGVFQGHVPVGGACFTRVDCAGDTFCKRSASGCPGTCTARAPLGGACASISECSGAPGTVLCAASTGEPRCEAVNLTLGAGEGAVCTHRAGIDMTACAEGLWCDPDDAADLTNRFGKCRTPIALGGLCDDTDDACVATAICNDDVSMCTEVHSSITAGTPCQAEWPLRDVCSPSANLACDTGVCRELGDGTLGSVCYAADGYWSCDVGLYCATEAGTRFGACTAQFAAGTGCATGRECLSGSCQGGVCLTDYCASDL